MFRHVHEIIFGSGMLAQRGEEMLRSLPGLSTKLPKNLVAARVCGQKEWQTRRIAKGLRRGGLEV